MKKRWKWLIVGGLILALTRPVLAEDLEVVCKQSGGCRSQGEKPLFGEGVIWYPGLKITKTVKITHQANGFRAYRVKGEQTEQVNNLAEAMQLSIVRHNDGVVVWAGSMSKFYQAGEVVLESIADGSSKSYSFTASLPQTTGNAYQGGKTVFDLKLGFEAPVVENEGEIVSGCSDPVPAEAPVLLEAVPGVNQVTLRWSEGKGPLTYYLVAYGTSPGNYQYGNPDIGGPGTTEYTVSNLSGGETYYFVVRAGNGCAPGPFSNELAVVPSGNQIEEEVAEGFEEGVLGTATESGKIKEEERQEMVESGVSGGRKKWWEVAVVVGSLGLIGWLLRKKIARQ